VEVEMKRKVIYVLVVGLLLKILLVLANGSAYDLNSDDRSYLTTAKIWLETGMFTYNDPERPTVFITPLFPAVLAGLMKVLGPGVVLEQTVRVLQAVMVTLGLYGIFRIGCKVFSERVGFWAVVMMTIYPPLWLMSNLILTEAVFFMLAVWLVIVALQAMERPTYGMAALFGLVWALTVYARPTIALWPGLLFVWMLIWRQIPWAQLMRCGLVVALVLVLCLSPWWVRNYQVSDGQFIPLTKSGGNPLLLGTFPWGLPSLEEQRTWHRTNNLWENDEFDTRWAKERIREGFAHDFWGYLTWYTVGKFGMFWGDVYYWIPIVGIPKAAVYALHLAVVLLGFWGMWLARRSHGAQAILLLLGYMTVLHMIYLAHGRYSAPLMPFVALFAAHAAVRLLGKGKVAS
jgi:4-amino-4-deoxy-L-arabinose transferase-like glycosyltransferase